MKIIEIVLNGERDQWNVRSQQAGALFRNYA